MKFIIKKLTVEQIPQFHAVFTQVMRESFEYTPKIKKHFITKAYSAANFDYWLKYGSKSVLVAKKENNIIGFLVYDKPYGGVLFCRWLGVLKDYQRKGVGQKLLDEFICQAKALACHKIEVASQPSAREFYQKYGLKEEGYRRQSYFGIDQYLFGKIVGKVEEERIIHG